jgi:hypothetical protein
VGIFVFYLVKGVKCFTDCFFQSLLLTVFPPPPPALVV